MSRPPMTRHLALFPATLAILLAAGCAKPVPMTRADAAAAAACRTRADEIYLKQNRALMSVRDQRDDPFAATGISGNTTEGLGDLYGRDQMLANCLNSIGPAAPNGAASGVGPAMTPGSSEPDSALTPN